MNDSVSIYVQVLEDGVPSCNYRPVMAEPIGELIYKVLAPDGYDPNADELEFPPGTIVKCVKHTRKTKTGESIDIIVAESYV